MASADKVSLEIVDLYLELSFSRFYPFLLETVRPRLDSLRERRILADWQFQLGGELPPSSARWIRLRCRPWKGISLEELDSDIQATLREPLHAEGGRFRMRSEIGAPKSPLSLRLRQFGGERGIKIHGLFMRQSADLLIALLDQFPSPPESGGEEMTMTALCSTVFYLHAFGCTQAEIKQGLKAWVTSFGGVLDPSGGTTELARRWAAQELTTNGDLRNQLRDLLRDGWRQAPERLKPVFAKYEPRMRRIGRLLRSNTPYFHHTKPFPLTVFACYIHYHNSRLSVWREKELCMYALVESSAFALEP